MAALGASAQYGLCETRTAGVVLLLCGSLFAWWGWKQGAYFDPVFYPGAISTFALLGILLTFSSFDGRISGAALVAVIALIGLAAWTMLSVLWSPTPSAAFRYGEHAFLYLALFAIGLWVTNMLRDEMRAALAPLAIAGTAIGIGVVVVLATGMDTTWYLHGDATLRFPLGYRNANAAFFLICFWPLLALATESDWRWEFRALMVGAGTMLLELAFLAQSRVDPRLRRRLGRLHGFGAQPSESRAGAGACRDSLAPCCPRSP